MRVITKGATDQSVTLYIVDNTTGLPATSLAYNSSGIDLWYRREGAAVTSITEATQTANGAHSDGGFVHLANGVYRLDLPDAAVASGVDSVTVGGTLTGYTVYPVTIQLVAVNLQDAVRGGMTALPNANAEAPGGLYTRGTGAGQINQANNGQIDCNAARTGGTTNTGRDIGASVLLSPGTGTGQISLSSGAVTVGTNNDKTGYALTQSFPPNFAALGINASGHVSRVTLADTVTTLTGHTPQTGDSYALANGAQGFAALMTVSNALTADVQATLADTNELQGLWTSGGALRLRYPTSGTIAVEGDLQTAAAAAIAAYDGPTNAEMEARTLVAASYATAAALATVDTVVDAIAAEVTATLSAATSAASAAGSAATIVGSGTHGNAALKTLIDAKPTAAQLLATAVATSNTANTVGDCLNAARAQGFGKWSLNASTKELKLYAPDGTTVVATFDVGPDLTAPLTRTPQ